MLANTPSPALQEFLNAFHQPAWFAPADRPPQVLNASWTLLHRRMLPAGQTSFDWLAVLHPDEHERVQALHSTHLTLGTPYQCSVRLSHSTATAQLQVMPCQPPGGPAGWLGVLHLPAGETPSWKDQQALLQSQMLQQITARLVNATEPRQMVEVVMECTRSHLDVQAVALFLMVPDSDVLRLESWTGAGEALALIGKSCSLGDPAVMPAALVGQALQPLYYASLEAVVQDFPLVVHLPAHLQTPSKVYLPLYRGQHRLGVLFLGFAGSHAFAESERAFLHNIADQVSHAVERSQAQHKEKHLLQDCEQHLARLQALLDNAPIGMAFLDPQLRFQMVNPKFAEHSRHTAAEHLHKTLGEMGVPAGQAFEGALKQVLERGQPALGLEFDSTHLCSTPTMRDFRVNLFPVQQQDGQLLGVGCTVQDITEHRQAEQALRESQHFLTRITDTTPAFIHLTRFEDGRIVYANPYLSDVLGYGMEDLEHMTEDQRAQLVHPEEVPALRVLQQSLQTLQDGETLEREHRIRHRDGHWRWLYGRSAVFSRDPQGKPLLVLNASLDITDRKETEVALQRSEAQTREMMDVQKRFVADAAHELRTPLTAIQGNLDILLRYSNIPVQDQKEIIGDVQREAARLGRLVHDMLQLARGDAGAILREEEVEWHQVVLEVWRDLQRVHRDHHFELPRLDPVVLLGDQDRLKQLALILLENALKYTLPGGTVSLRLEHQGTQVRLKVTDNGIGIAAGDLERVFERFYRADRSRHRGTDPGGTGLGLPIARWIVEQHGGKIWLESGLDQGTTAFVQLPIREIEPDF